MILQKIIADRDSARLTKQEFKLATLSTLIGEIQYAIKK